MTSTPKTPAEHLQLLNEVAAKDYTYPAERFVGRGIVICAGGERYFTNAYVCVRVLRMLGCHLPIQFWHLGPDEMTDEMRDIAKPYGVECVDAYDVRKKYPARTLNGWELKPYAIIHSPFEEVLALDADNVAVRNPEFLFNTPEYQKTGAIFWPDYGRLGPDRTIWELTGIAYRDEPEFESGQIVVDKRRCWKALQVTMHLNEYSDHYYNHVHGDKETFHLAWRKIEQEYAMPAAGIHSLAGTMCQHDFNGRRLFQHRNMCKWRLNAANENVGDFMLEAECLQFIEELRRQWSKSIKTLDVPEFAALAELLVRTREWLYCRVGYDTRQISFSTNGRMIAGSGSVERQWQITGTPAKPCVTIFDNADPICELQYSGGMLHGRWVAHEKMPIVCLPANDCRRLSQINREWASQHGEDRWIADNIPLPETGVFVEIGVNDGLLDSNTLWLEHRGWRGLLVEADERNIFCIKLFRTTAVVHCAVTSVDNSEIDFAQSPDSSLSGVRDARGAEKSVKVKTRRLDSLLREHNLLHVDVLSVDTEGTELDVLDSLGEYRPTIIICEFLTVGRPSNRDNITNKLQALGYTVRHATAANIIAVKNTDVPA